MSEIPPTHEIMKTISLIIKISFFQNLDFLDCNLLIASMWCYTCLEIVAAQDAYITQQV